MQLGGLEEPVQPISIELAFQLLSRQAFALWIRLMTVAPVDLRSGRTHLAATVELPRRVVNRYLRELCDKEFVKFRARRGTFTRIIPLLVPLLTQPHHFRVVS